MYFFFSFSFIITENKLTKTKQLILNLNIISKINPPVTISMSIYKNYLMNFNSIRLEKNSEFNYTKEN